MGAAADGYPDATTPVLLLLIYSHIFLFASIHLGWQARHVTPWLVVSLVACLVASAQYHECYSFDVCYFNDHRLARHLDHFFSGMTVPVSLSHHLWNRRPIQSLPIHKRAVQNLEWYRPLIITPLVAFLYIFNLYAHVYHGIDHFGSVWVIALSTTIMASAGLTEVVATGLRPRLQIILAVAAPLSVGYTLFLLDDQLGAAGHAGWHAFSMTAQYIYLRWGPIFVAHDLQYHEMDHSSEVLLLQAAKSRARRIIPRCPRRPRELIPT